MVIISAQGDVALLVFIILGFLKYLYVKDKLNSGFKVMLAGGLILVFSAIIPAFFVSDFNLAIFDTIRKVVHIIGFSVASVGIFMFIIELLKE